MKLVIAVVQVYDTDRLLRVVTEAGLRATRIVSTGGFLRMQNATVLMGVENERVQEAIALVRRVCAGRIEVRADVAPPEFAEWIDCGIQEELIGGGVIFVVPVARFTRMRAQEQPAVGMETGT